MNDIRQTSGYCRYMVSIGWLVEKVGTTYIYIKRLPIVGSVIKVQRPKSVDQNLVTTCLQLMKKYRTFKTTIEPLTDRHARLLIDNGYKLSRAPSLPSKTIHINLAGPEVQLLANMHPKTRYNIKVAQRSSVVVTPGTDIYEFARFWQHYSPAGGLLFNQQNNIVKLYEAFESKATLLLAHQSTNLLGGILMLKSTDCAYYMYAASSGLGKSLHAPTLLVWEAIINAKQSGLKLFDFEGIYDKRFPLSNWLGFTKFKKSFGGNDVVYPGCFTKTTPLFRLR